MNTVFWMVQNKWMYLQPKFHLVIEQQGLWFFCNNNSLLPSMTFTCMKPGLNMYLPILIHMLLSFYCCYLILFEEKLLGSWSWLTYKRPKYMSYILKEQIGMGLRAPHSDWKRIITYYSFLDPWRTSEASLMLHCSFLVPINRKHAPNSLPQGKTTALLCHKHFWLFGGCREDLRVLQWW